MFCLTARRVWLERRRRQSVMPMRRCGALWSCFASLEARLIGGIRLLAVLLRLLCRFVNAYFFRTQQNAWFGLEVTPI